MNVNTYKSYNMSQVFCGVLFFLFCDIYKGHILVGWFLDPAQLNDDTLGPCIDTEIDCPDLSYNVGPPNVMFVGL